MTTPRRPLPRSLAPLPEESLPGYLLRLAHRLGQSPDQTAQLCGLPSRPPAGLAARNLVALPNETAAMLAAATRLSPAEAHGLTLRQFAAAYPPLTPAIPMATTAGQHGSSWMLHNWVLDREGRYCPDCLAGDTSPIQQALGGPWKLRWHLPITLACTIHRRLLNAVCPACGNTPGGPVGLIREPSIRGLHPTQCRACLETAQHREHRQLCAARLDQAPSTTTPIPDTDLHSALVLQQRLDHLFATDPRTARGYVLDLVTASQLIAITWPACSAFAPTATAEALIDTHAMSRPGKPRAGSLQIRPWSAPRDPAHRAALLLAAEALIQDCGHDPAASQNLIHRYVRGLSLARFQRHSQPLHADSALANALTRPTPDTPPPSPRAL